MLLYRNNVKIEENNPNSDVFLQKALENLAKNKLHYTEDSNELTGKTKFIK